MQQGRCLVTQQMSRRWNEGDTARAPGLSLASADSPPQRQAPGGLSLP